MKDVRPPTVVSAALVGDLGGRVNRGGKKRPLKAAAVAVKVVAETEERKASGAVSEQGSGAAANSQLPKKC